jgi:hypothetical protein
MRRTLPLAALLALLVLAPAAPAATFAPIGDQLRLSKMGTDGDDTGFVGGKAIGYDERDDRYLAVFNGRDVAPEKRSLFAQPVDPWGAPIGPRKLIADTATDGTTPFDVLDAAVVWNPDAREFLAVWAGRPVAGDGRDIFARRISPDGDPLGTVPTRVSLTGPVAADPQREARGPSVAYNSVDHEYLVVWAADDLHDGHTEVLGQRLRGADALLTGPDDFAISQTGATATEPTDNARPEVAYDSHDDEYMVAWRGQFTTAGSGGVIRAQRLTAAGTETGEDDFRVSNPRSAAAAKVDSVDLAYNPSDDDYLVVYDQEPSGGEREIQARHIGQAGAGRGRAAGVRQRPRGRRGIRAVRPGGGLQPSPPRVPGRVGLGRHDRRPLRGLRPAADAGRRRRRAERPARVRNRPRPIRKRGRAARPWPSPRFTTSTWPSGTRTPGPAAWPPRSSSFSVAGWAKSRIRPPTASALRPRRARRSLLRRRPRTPGAGPAPARPY